MFDFGTKSLAASVVAGAALLAGAQTTTAATFTETLGNYGDFDSTSTVGATISRTFALGPYFGATSFSVDNGEGFYASLQDTSAGVSNGSFTALIELELNGVFVPTTFNDFRTFTEGDSDIFINFSPSGVLSFGPATLTAVRFSSTLNSSTLPAGLTTTIDINSNFLAGFPEREVQFHIEAVSDVALATGTPEPATAGMFSIASGAFLLLTRRRRSVK